MNGFVLVSFMCLLLSGVVQAAPSPSPSVVNFDNFSRQTTVLGKAFGVNYQSASNSSQTGLVSDFAGTILGKKKDLIQTVVQPSPDFSQGQSTVYVDGIELTMLNGVIENARWSKSVQIPPANINATLVTVPIGPVIVQVRGGYSLSGGVNAQLVLGQAQSLDPAVPGQVFGVAAQATAAILAEGYIEGGASLLVLRAGVRGQVDVADGNAQTLADLYFGKFKPHFSSSGKLSIFQGAVSLFADYYGFLSGWQRFWSANIVNWPGWCFGFKNGVQVKGKCAAQ